MKRSENRAFEAASILTLAFASICCLLPFALLVVSSFTDETTIIRNGYAFLPEKFSLEAYRYMARQSESIVRAYLVTAGVTVVGTTSCLLLTTLMAYPLSRRDFPLRRAFSFYVVFTILFNGGMVPTYLMYTQVFHIKNTYFALLIPGLLMSGFNVLLVRTFFVTSIPTALIESAGIDGAGEFRIFWQIVLPLSLPILATVGLLSGIAYWNDWYNGLLFLTKPKLFTIQNILNRMLADIQFLASSNLGTNTAQAASSIPGMTVRMAIAVVGIVPILAAYPFFQGYFVKGITLGAVKG